MSKHRNRVLLFSFLILVTAAEFGSAVRDAEIACRLGECEAKILMDVFKTSREDAGEMKKNENRH